MSSSSCLSCIWQKLTSSGGWKIIRNEPKSPPGSAWDQMLFHMANPSSFCFECTCILSNNADIYPRISRLSTCLYKHRVASEILVSPYYRTGFSIGNQFRLWKTRAHPADLCLLEGNKEIPNQGYLLQYFLPKDEQPGRKSTQNRCCCTSYS